MAPINGSAKPRRHGSSKLAQPPKTVVPAIPLPYVKRQADAAAASAPAPAPAPAPTPMSTASASTNPPSATAPRHKTKLTNGAATSKAKKNALAEHGTAEAPVAPAGTGTGNGADAKIGGDGAGAGAGAGAGVTPTPAIPATSAAKTTKNNARYTRPKNGPQTSNGAAVTNHQDSLAASTPSEPDAAAKASSTSDHPHHPTAPKASAQDSRLPNHAPGKPKGTASKNDVKANSAEHLPARHNTKLRPPSAVSPTRYQMPPPFQPANRSLNAAVNGDMPRPHRPHVPNGPHLHQPHPSNGSIHFGTFHGSASSSPAPPLSGGIAPPPGMPGPDGRPPYMGPAANGFPPMMPYSRDMMPTFDNYGRPSMGYGPMDSYPPYGNNFGPSTPHSFHDSQSSAHPDDNSGMYQYPSGPVRNGVAGPGDDSNLTGRVIRGPDFPRMMPNPGFPPHLMPPSDDAEGLIGHLQQQFGSPDFADCVLELRYLDGRVPPVRILGHRIVLSRSPELASYLMKPSPQPSPGFPSLPTILLETKSKWIRSDSFYTATQRLYGHPLFPIPPPTAFKQSDMAEAGSVSERLDFALSYAAAGHLLNWEPITRRGCEIALQLINGQTLERVLEFALEDRLDKGSHHSYKYGEGSRMILNGVVAHVVNNLPSDFVLDTSVAEPEKFRRFPPYPTPPGTPVTQKPSTPPIARGTSVHLGRPRRSHQITGIQFGDLSVSEGPKPSQQQQAQSPSHAVISRILLNVPFEFLKMALESGSNSATGWANPEYRCRVINDVVTERERRRLQAVDAIRSGRVPGWESILTHISTPEPRYFDEWSALGWQEEIFPYGSPEGPSLGRTWVPLMNAQNGSTAEYP